MILVTGFGAPISTIGGQLRSSPVTTQNAFVGGSAGLDPVVNVNDPTDIAQRIARAQQGKASGLTPDIIKQISPQVGQAAMAILQGRSPSSVGVPGGGSSPGYASAAAVSSGSNLMGWVIGLLLAGAGVFLLVKPSRR